MAPHWIRLILGSAPSALGALSVPLCFLAVHPRPEPRDITRSCLWGLAILFLAEFIEQYLPRSTFAFSDLAAAVLGILAAGLVARGLLSWTRPADLRQTTGS